MQIATLAESVRIYAPDGSEIRELVSSDRGSVVHCRLPPGVVSNAVKHLTVEEIWYVLSGQGEVWRKLGDSEQVDRAVSGTCLSIPSGSHFQFRNVGEVPFQLMICTMPPWPGSHEAVPVADHWPMPAKPGSRAP